uniref:Ribosomal protein L11 methyltransferase n=1 Tax=uncultured Thiotrichaceae bacterium TaxID=298394 RepID=A0A6S6ST11_9GAMM|nr:MAG: Ribosomal protein L11 methyltransferase (EC [uncultured Thiotrichaceae bacterium]
MTWQQIICQTTSQHQESISELLENAGAASVTLQDAADQPVLEPLPGETPLWDNLVMVGLFQAEADLTQILLMLELQRNAGIISDVKLEQLEDKPWVREWMSNFHPMQFGERLWIYPSWSEPPDDASIKILLDPGLAFGTGNHPTTALCLAWLDGEDLTDKTVLDYGCGSGILAIAAAKLGAGKIVATDIDPQALQATQDNAERNGLSAEAIHTCFPEDLEAETYDVVIANILAGPLVSLSSDILGHLKPEGRLALSGILQEQTEMVSKAYSSALTETSIETKEDWIRISGSSHLSAKNT